MRGTPSSMHASSSSALQGASRSIQYTRSTTPTRLLVEVYVDDLVITGSDSNDIDKFKLEMKSLFQMSNLGLLSYYLGIDVHQGPSGSISRRRHMPRNCWRMQ